MGVSKRTKKFAKKGGITSQIKQRHRKRSVKDVKSKRKQEKEEDAEMAKLTQKHKSVLNDDEMNASLKSVKKAQNALENMDVSEFLSGGFLEGSDSDDDSVIETDHDGTAVDREING